ncbi:MAG: alpha/beta hydrolase [Rhodospirillaceae bacterium]|nr:alpha/beta hydrolase [Rhodospirillaceae bacterium]
MAEITIAKHFLPLKNGQQVHYRRAGSGPPIILMHPSPSSSLGVVPAMNVFAQAFTCIGLDTPGYGLSDEIVSDPTMLWGYADALIEILDALGIGKAIVYGAATGAQVGIQFARKYPNRCRLLMLDANGDFSGEAGEHMANGYFQDITPVRDGSHLIRIWDMCRQLSVFFPWQSMLAEDRAQNDVAPPDATHRSVLDYLRAGPNYKGAYYQAMLVETWENTRQVTIETLMTRNSGSVLLKHTDALLAKGLPPNFTILPCAPATRFTVQLAALKERMSKDALPVAPPSPPDHQPGQNRVQNFYMNARGGKLRARGNMSGQGRPLLALHDPAGSSKLVEPILAPWLGKRPIIALDLPGNGESDNVIDPANITSAAYAEIVNEALATFGVSEVDVIGRYSGGPVAMEMSFQKPALVKHLILAGIGIYEGAEQKDLLDNYTPSISPKWDGSHLVTAWAVMRDQGLFWPWFNRTKNGILWNDNAIDEDMIHLRVTEMLKIGDQYQKAYAAMWAYPMRERLPKIKAPCLLAVPKWEPIYAKSAEAQKIAPQCKLADLPPAVKDWHTVIEPFLAA